MTRDSESLKDLQIPASISNLTGNDVFRGVDKVERLILLGWTLSPGVVAIVQSCLTSTAKVFGPALVGQKCDRFTIAAI
jgi:hypothetical protein